MISRAFNALLKRSIAYNQKRSFSVLQTKEEKITGEASQANSQPKIQAQESKITQPNKEKRDQDEQDVPFQKENRNTIGWRIYRLLFWGSFSILAYNTYLVYNHDKKTPVEQEPTAVPFFIDAAKTLVDKYEDLMEFMTQPPSNKLLPDTVHPLLHPKTLVLNLSGTLIKTDFIFGKGMTVIRRPGLSNFLAKLAPKYQIIIFSDEDTGFLMNAINLLDSKRMIFVGCFGRQSMVFSKGQYIKDLKYLNRDLKNIIVIDSKKSVVKNQPENVIVLPQFDGSQDDQELAKLLSLLECTNEDYQDMSNPQIRDVRKFLSELGENPYTAYYEKMKDKQKKIQEKQKSGIFGIFNSTKKINTGLDK